ncbi:hypothetical protein BCR35DRAFT_325733 [Leucosporidium creatinivorum]|uniref:START domain-containing protein n=1 Tax=Leucosporidium creatinivorum TaxID=106004 RepID=A0A1Y2EWG1_9BASI|nr:hypothetical protein BCR35DRAFT_325733 [Leucosporidium creatinivorum]
MLDNIKAKAKSLKSSGESQYEYEASFRDGAESTYDSDDDDVSTSQGGADLSRRVSSYASNDDTDAHLATAERALSTLEDLHSRQSSHWKRALKHRSGTIVYYSKEKMPAGTKKSGKQTFSPVFKGELDIEGFSPAEVFGVVGSRKLWDDWYKEGNLVENLSDTSSLTYMCMQGIAGSSTRDLSLVEKVAGSPTGTISFVSTSVVTPKVPRVSGRVRATLALNGWVLEPIDGGTRITYYLLVNVRTFVPALLHKKYLARRPTCVAKIAEYLQKNGAPPMVGVEEIEPVSPSATGGAVPIPRRRGSISSKRSRSASASTVYAGLPEHVEVNTDANSYSEVQKAIKLFHSLNEQTDWTLAVDQKQRKIWKGQAQGKRALLVKGEATVEGATTEQVLGTILSDTARREWDTRFSSSALISQDNGFDQGDFLEVQKEIFPALSARHALITRSIDREDSTSPNSPILVVSRSIRNPSSSSSIDLPRSSTKIQLDLSGFLLTPLSDTTVKITHITQIDLALPSLTPTLRKILTAEYATTASRIAEFIDDEGYAPSFLRWGAGPATLERSSEGDLQKGEITFLVGGEGKGTMKDGQQKAWLQYSDKMYERGLDITVNPEGAATVAKVEGCERTVEFVWSEKVREGGVRVLLTRADGDGADDVLLGGEYLDRTVGMEKGSGARKKAPIAAATRRTSTNEDTRSNGSETTMVEDQPNKSKGLAETTTTSAAALLASKTRSTGAAAQDVSPPSASVDTKQRVKGELPDDACLILSEDLYFTRSQCAFMGAVVVGAYVWGKLS